MGGGTEVAVVFLLRVLGAGDREQGDQAGRKQLSRLPGDHAGAKGRGGGEQVGPGAGERPGEQGAARDAGDVDTGGVGDALGDECVDNGGDEADIVDRELGMARDGDARAGQQPHLSKACG